MKRLLGACVGALLLLAGCQDPVDKAAKKRIFSPEDPPKVIASAAEKLPPEQVADNPQIADRVLRMGAAETTERIGPHKYFATVTFEWSGGPAGPVKLNETRTLWAGPGGVNGDFHAVVDNSRDQGLDVMRVGGQVYARSRYGKFRQRLRDRGIAERTREDTFGALRDVEAMFDNRIALKHEGTREWQGRTAWNYTVALAPKRDEPEAQVDLPAVAKAKNGMDPASTRRVAFEQKREPTALTGEVLVDAETSVVLKARIDGRMVVPGDKGENPAQLKIVVDQALTEIGKDPHLTTPKDFLPDQDKPEGIADALDRFGIPRGSTVDGGTPAVLQGKKGKQAEDSSDSDDQ